MDWILGNSPDILTLNGGLNIREQEHQDQTKRVSFGTSVQRQSEGKQICSTYVQFKKMANDIRRLKLNIIMLKNKLCSFV